MHRCINHTHGCTYQNARPDVAAQHSRKCTLTATITPRQKPHLCLVEGCDSAFDGEWELHNHMKRHNWVSKICPVVGCDAGKVYETKATFDKHRSDAHGKYKSKLCGVPGCTNTTMWKTRGTHGQHLDRTHQIFRKDQPQYLYPETDWTVSLSAPLMLLRWRINGHIIQRLSGTYSLDHPISSALLFVYSDGRTVTRSETLKLFRRGTKRYIIQKVWNPMVCSCYLLSTQSTDVVHPVHHVKLFQIARYLSSSHTIDMRDRDVCH